MLEILIIVCLVLWLLGGFVIPVGGNAIHFLVVIALVLVIVRLLQGHRV